MYDFKITSEVSNCSIGEGFGRAVPKSADSTGSPGSAWSGFPLAPKAQVAIAREVVLSEAFCPHKARLDRLKGLVIAELSATPPRPDFIPAETPIGQNYRGALFLPLTTDNPL